MQCEQESVSVSVKLIDIRTGTKQCDNLSSEEVQIKDIKCLEYFICLLFFIIISFSCYIHSRPIPIALLSVCHMYAKKDYTDYILWIP